MKPPNASFGSADRAGRDTLKAILILCFVSFTMTIWAWDYEGHRMVNQLALAALPTNFPSFVATAAARERIAFLAGEPDRWRNSPELTLKHFNGPDHYLDLEDLEPLKLSATTLGPFRYEFMSQQAVVRHARPADFPAIDPEKNQDRTKQLVGFLPWTITEYYGKLKSGFSYLKVFEDGGTAEEVANARQNIIYIMGVMGHFVGDASQPLHTTKHYNGWLEPNPKHYPTNNTFHAWVDGGYIRQVGIQLSELNARPAQLLGSANPNGKPEDIFPVVMSFVLLQHRMVEPLYQLEKEGRLSATNIDPRGRAFIVRQLGVGAEMLADLWLTAWRHAPSDKYLQSQLVRRKLATQGAPKKP